MSTQGTGSAVIQSYEEELLKDWGRWVRSTSLGMGYASLKKINPGLGFAFPLPEILLADRTTAGLPRHHKSVIKRWFWFEEHDVSDIAYVEALTVFAEELEKNREAANDPAY